MPMHAWLPGDIDPCDECKKRGIAVAETLEDGKELTGCRWLLQENAVVKMLEGERILNSVLDKRVMLIAEGAARMFGLHEVGTMKQEITEEVGI